MDDKSKQETKRFFLGDSESDDDSEWDEPKERRFSVSDRSDCSLDDVVGGVPTNLNFDEDSGIGMSIDSERDSISSNEIIPLKPVNIGKGSSKYAVHKQQSTRRKYRFSDFYEMHDLLGIGAYGSVSTCISLQSGMEFAVKLVNKHEPGHTRSRILREVDVFKMCKGHPNIVQLIEWFEDDDHFYMVFEKMQGGPLLSQIQNKGCFNEQEAARVAKDIANALKFLHSRGVAHRDLKPENVLCVSMDSVSPVKLCDLDLASKPKTSMRRPSRQLHNVISEPDLSSPVGSAEFLAPEVVETFVGESLKYNRQCDLWSLGIIIYIMLCGYVPFYGCCNRSDSCGWNEGQKCDDCQEDLFEKIREGKFEFPDEEWDNISDDAKDLISHLLVKNVRQRYTANDVLNHRWITSAPETPLQTPNNLFRKNSTKDIQQYNDHFNINHFANRLSSRVEETIPSVGSTPENESALQNAMENSHSQDLIMQASKLLEQQPLTEDAQIPIESQMHYPPPLINMNGVMIYAPPMAQQQLPYFYPYADLNSQYNPISKLETSAEQIDRVKSSQLDNVDVTKLQQKHRGSLATAISQLGLETCQNMVRQGSSSKDIRQSNEIQANV